MNKHRSILVCALVLGACGGAADDDQAEQRQVAESGFVIEPKRPSDATYRELGLNLPEAEPAYPLAEAPALPVEPEEPLSPGGVAVPDALAALLPRPTINKDVVGNDNRMPVADTQVQPYSTIATLIVSFPGTTKRGLCTGSFIAPDAVLTAAHCIYKHDIDALASNVRVIPGAYPDPTTRQLIEPFGATSGRSIHRPQAYVDAGGGSEQFYERERHDYAVIRTNLPLGNQAGVRAYGVLADPKTGRFVQLVGYHGDKCVGGPALRCTLGSHNQHWSSDQIRQVFTGFFNHFSDSEGGASGSPLVTDGSDFNRIFAVHVAGLAPDGRNHWNMGTLIDEVAYYNIRQWANH